MAVSALVCTVGGSHQPIVTAIRDTQPDHVVFLCTDRDPTTGQPGSRIQVEGKGSVIKNHPKDPAPTLANIPTQCALAADGFQVRIVSADDLDDVVARAQQAFADLRGHYPEARLLADYTGGTKTMTAGLVMAALERNDVELRLVTGARGDLVRVHDGSQRSIAASADAVRLRRAMEPFMGAWKRYGYGEAALGLASIAVPKSQVLRSEWWIARDLSKALDAWDRFDHATALDILVGYRPRIGERAGRHLTFLDALTAPDEDPRREPARLLDLWLNAQRRAAQGRYDDAVARAYRLLEWTAQWLLREHAGIHTADVPAQQIPEGLVLTTNRDGKRQAGLDTAWQLVRAFVPGAPGQFAEEERDRMRNHLKMRNESILAHGFRPVTEQGWQGFYSWMAEAFVPMLRTQAAAAGLRMDPPQLPLEPIWDSPAG